MIAPDEAFADAANAAAAAFAATPPYLAYRVAVATGDGSRGKSEYDDVVVRTSDGVAIVRGPGGTQQLPAPPALPGAVDALAEWAFAPQTLGGHAVLHVNYEEPKRYAFPTPGPGLDAVAASISGFSVAYATGEPDHLVLSPSTSAVRALALQPNRFLYRDVWFDPATLLPTRVVVAAANGTLSVDYATAGGHWLLAHARYETLDRGHRTVIDATYSDYAFPSAFRAPRSGA